MKLYILITLLLCGCKPSSIHYNVKHETNQWYPLTTTYTNIINWSTNPTYQPKFIYEMEELNNPKTTNTHFWMADEDLLFKSINGRVLVWSNGYRTPVQILELSPSQFQKVWDSYPSNQQHHNFAFGKP